MKRYRFANFYIDSTRNIIKSNNLPKRSQDQMLSGIKQRFGENDFDLKLKRYLSLKTPVVRLIPEYHDLFLEVADAYASGYFYPALTGACCLGERIFNDLIINLSDCYKSTPSFKEVYGKESFQDWFKAIGVLKEWGILDEKLVEKYSKLGKIRHKSIHFTKMRDFPNQALEALQTINKIIDQLFGLRKDIFFWVNGEPYIKKEVEDLPIVKKYFIPNCALVGYEHRVGGGSGEFTIIDDNAYESRDITDDEFAELRNKFHFIV